mmetsp:Transcript_8792/g.14980  ORF Transcript_8792/g.14980 Transcript_8792/m.14980 type:complete len:515 (+) Transcript_8792:68-1612(+)
MKNMSKKEQILARKTIEARRVKNESLSASGKLPKKARRGASGRQLGTLQVPPGGYGDSMGSSSNYSGQFSPLGSSRSNISESIRNVEKYYENEMSQADMALSQELSNRGITQEAYIRKMTNEALARASQIDKANTDDSVDIFMPKVRKLRPDGASLSQVYESKREDVWGKILKEQIVEEDRVNMEKKIRKDLADANYGKALRQQRRDRDAIDRAYVDRGDVMVKSSGVWDQFEVRNRVRMAEKNKNHARFVANAVEDMEKKRAQKNEDLQKELEGSAYLIRKAQRAQEVENERLAAQKQAQAAEQNRLLQENFALLEKRRIEREKKHSDDRKYVKEMDEKFQREEDRRQAERDRKAATNSTERGAFVMASKVHEEKMRKTEDFFAKNMSSSNLLNTTLQNSEKTTNERIENSKKALQDEFAIQRKKMAETRDTRGQEIEEQRAAMNQKQKQYLIDLEKEREQKVKAATTYQRLLDSQLKSLRQRSLDALEDTMAEKEKDMNAALLRKYGIPMKK